MLVFISSTSFSDSMIALENLVFWYFSSLHFINEAWRKTVEVLVFDGHAENWLKLQAT